ncbi:hypothetical protein [Novacetimonas hansenii]|uniref:hypothetical protein n=1 Tax=Novacetimonas hansenii TaxID=436 RepID=UPI00094FBE90|nr:hypothetical protein [Novacetimonas hansenii]
MADESTKAGAASSAAANAQPAVSSTSGTGAPAAQTAAAPPAVGAGADRAQPRMSAARYCARLARTRGQEIAGLFRSYCAKNNLHFATVADFDARVADVLKTEA